MHLDADPPAGVRYHLAAFDARGARITDGRVSAEQLQAFGETRLMLTIPREQRPRSKRRGLVMWQRVWHAMAGKGAERVMDEADWEALWNLYRRYHGAAGASAHDTDHRTPAWFRERIDGMDPDALRLRLGRLVRDEFLSEEELAKGYGLAHVRPFLDFLKDELGQDV